MTAHRIRGPFGRELVIEVPGPGVSEVTFTSLVNSGEWTVIPDPEPAEDNKPTPKKRAPRKPKTD